MLLSNPHLSFAAGFGTTLTQVAGFHRAVPSTTLDKACMQFGCYYIEKNGFVKYFSSFFPFIVHNSVVDFSCKCATIGMTIHREVLYE